MGKFATPVLVQQNLVAARLTRDPVRMILTGAALAAFFSAMITVVVAIGEPQDIQNLYAFLVGSLTGRDWGDVWLVLPWLSVGLVVAMLFGRVLNLLQLGDDIAEGLGLRVFRTRALVLAVAIFLTASVVAVCGPIGFVALIVPHMVRGLLRSSDTRQVLPVSAVLGAVVLSGSDLVAREVFKPTELPVGVVTVVIGAPVALYLLRRLVGRRRAV